MLPLWADPRWAVADASVQFGPHHLMRLLANHKLLCVADDCDVLRIAKLQKCQQRDRSVVVAQALRVNPAVWLYFGSQKVKSLFNALCHFDQIRALRTHEGKKR